ncbi:hypothetical protein MMPV_000016 [Pyropia vietnamensis]
MPAAAPSLDDPLGPALRRRVAAGGGDKSLTPGWSTAAPSLTSVAAAAGAAATPPAIGGGKGKCASPSPPPLPTRGRWARAAAFVTLTTAIVAAAVAGYTRRPPVVPASAPPWVFSGARSHAHVTALAGRMRWVGTAALDDAMAAIEAHLDALAVVAASNGYVLERGSRSASGSFLSSIGPIPLVNSYANVSNIVVRVYRADTPPSVLDARSAVVINAHVDSAVGSYGASDDVAAVGVALEVLSALLHTPPSVNVLVRPVVVLLNGAEEPVLMGAHGWVMDHPWAPTAGVLVNLEASGDGHSGLLFRLGPRHAWLARAYAAAATYPHGSSSSMDVFEAQLVPAETDWRVFHEVRGVPGLDMASYAGGERYHTHLDDIAHASPVFGQHLGENVLPLVWELAGRADALGRQLAYLVARGVDLGAPAVDGGGAPAALDPATADAIAAATDRAVYFDLLGRVMVVYSMRAAAVGNAALVAFTAALLATVGGASRRRWAALGVATAGVVVAYAATMAAPVVVALLSTAATRTRLVWYTHRALLPALYLPPAVAAPTMVLYWTAAAVNVVSGDGWWGGMKGPPPLSTTDAFAGAGVAVLAALTAGLTAADLTMAYVPAWCLVGALAGWAALHMCGSSTPTRPVAAAAESPPPPPPFGRLLACHALCLAPAAVLGVPITNVSVATFAGIMGRAGRAVPHPDAVLAIIVGQGMASSGLLPCLPFAGAHARALPVVRRLAVAASAASAVALAVIVAVASRASPTFTSVDSSGLAYGPETPQRVMLVHWSPPPGPPGGPPPTPVLVLGGLDANGLVLPPAALAAAVSPAALRSPLPPRAATWGRLASTPWEPYRPFLPFLSSQSMYEVASAPAFPAPVLSVSPGVASTYSATGGTPPPDDATAATAAASGAQQVVNVSITITAPGAHMLSVRFGRARAGLVAWSLAADLSAALAAAAADPGRPATVEPADAGGGDDVYVRHVGRGDGAEVWRLWVALRPGAVVPLDVSAARLGRSRSAGVLASLRLPTWVAAVYVVASGASAELQGEVGGVP